MLGRRFPFPSLSFFLVLLFPFFVYLFFPLLPAASGRQYLVIWRDLIWSYEWLSLQLVSKVSFICFQKLPRFILVWRWATVAASSFHFISLSYGFSRNNIDWPYAMYFTRHLKWWSQRKLMAETLMTDGILIRVNFDWLFCRRSKRSFQSSAIGVGIQWDIRRKFEAFCHK